MQRLKGAKTFLWICISSFIFLKFGYVSNYVVGDLLDGVFHFSTATFESAITDRSIEPMYQWSRFGSNWFLSLPLKIVEFDSAVLVRIVAMHSILLFSAWTILKRFFSWTTRVSCLVVLATNSSTLYAILDFYPTGAVIVWTTSLSALLFSIHHQQGFIKQKCVLLGANIVLIATSYPGALLISLLFSAAYFCWLIATRDRGFYLQDIFALTKQAIFVLVGLALGSLVVMTYNRLVFPSLNVFTTNKTWIRLLSGEETTKSNFSSMLAEGTVYTHLLGVGLAGCVAFVKRKEKHCWIGFIYAIPAVYLIVDAFIDLPIVAYAENRVFSGMYLGMSMLSICFSSAILLDGLKGVRGILDIGIIGIVTFMSTRLWITSSRIRVPLLIFFCVCVLFSIKRNKLGNVLRLGTVCLVVLITQISFLTGSNNRYASELYGSSEYSRSLRSNQVRMQKFVLEHSLPGDRLISDVQIGAKSSPQLMSGAAMSLFGRNSVYGWDWVWRPGQLLGLRPNKVVVYSTDLAYVNKVKYDITTVAEIRHETTKSFESFIETGESLNSVVTIFDVRYHKD